MKHIIKSYNEITMSLNNGMFTVSKGREKITTRNAIIALMNFNSLVLKNI